MFRHYQVMGSNIKPRRNPGQRRRARPFFAPLYRSQKWQGNSGFFGQFFLQVPGKLPKTLNVLAQKPFQSFPFPVILVEEKP
jgi:hypothetical protein